MNLFSICGVALLTILFRASAISPVKSIADHPIFDPNPDGRYLLLVLNSLGLSNRLRAMADWYQIAMLSNRILVVSWTPSLSCNAHFHDLFESVPSKLLFFPFFLKEENNVGQELVSSLATSRGLTSDCLDYHSDMNSIVEEPDIVMSSTNIILTYHNGVRALRNVPCQYYLSKGSEFLSSLVPIQPVRDFVDSTMRDHFSDKIMIGIHVRVHDPKFDWSVVPPTGPSVAGDNGSAGMAKQFGEGATVEDFAKVMASIEKKFTQSNGHTNHKFLITSNSDAVKATLMDMFPESVTVSGAYSRDTVDGMQVALAEWLLLSKASLVVNTYGSTFAYEAAKVHLRPIVGIWGGVLLHHSNLYLPYCGLLQFIKAYSSQGVKTRFTEGTVDNRVVDSVSIQMVPCTPLQEWGLDVYCTTHDPR